jgi:autotransporter translocation and assembly factor TamB
MEDVKPDETPAPEVKPSEAGTASPLWPKQKKGPDGEDLFLTIEKDARGKEVKRFYRTLGEVRAVFDEIDREGTAAAAAACAQALKDGKSPEEQLKAALDAGQAEMNAGAAGPDAPQKGPLTDVRGSGTGPLTDVRGSGTELTAGNREYLIARCNLARGRFGELGDLELIAAANAADVDTVSMSLFELRMG